MISRPSYRVIYRRIVFCDNFWDIFALGIIFNWKLWWKIISNYLKEVTRKYKWYSLVLAKVLHTCNIFKNNLHHRLFPCNFSIFSEFLENFGAGSWYRAFRFCTNIAAYALTFIFPKTHWVRNLTKNYFTLPNAAEWSPWLSSCYYYWVVNN